MARIRVLLVDDDEMVRLALGKMLEVNGFEVTCAADVPEALKSILTRSSDVLLSDLHMPGAGDGLTLVSAMRHANPKAVTLLLSSFPEMTAAANAILMQTDEVLVKPIQINELIDAINRLVAKGPLHKRRTESVADILERTAMDNIDYWHAMVEKNDEVQAIALPREARCEHLPQLFLDLATRLDALKPLGTKELRSESATHHGRVRRLQGYTAAMLVEESRLLQVTIFRTLQKNLATIDFSVLLLDVMTIADEVDSQLSQAMKSYVSAAAEEQSLIAA